MPQQPQSFRGRPRLDIPIEYRRRRRRRGLNVWVRVLLAVAVLGLASGVGAVSTNAFGARDQFEHLVAAVERRIDRFIAGPVPERSTRPTITVTPPPVAAATATPRPTNRPGPSDGVPTASPTPSPTPARVAVDVNITPDAERYFNHQVDKDWCAVAGTQIVLAIHGKGNTSDDFQREIASRIREWEAWDDSHNGNWGPAAMALALEAYGVPGYEIRAYDERLDALKDAARAIADTGAPAILLTWRGAHTWVMTGYRADADPRIFPDAKLQGIYIHDPWYPWVSNIWGASNPPGFLTSIDEMVDNYLRWERPEGAYPDRDGKFIAVVPTIPLER